ncbi:indolepyruvate ferredoxin oxidoreductase family protein [Oceaniglobus ichthyenteri]|uniref:indolepyruvate ferredoxin oxidoreductase family protein n=1 Tax=Oceaniglobus ichthyenteri TaxID=2136177 RepID=UPI000D37DBB1|nr:indolepyruvate ferredoxin oxidoreductase family protein [Oceaniglobus ichthyenteri]
MRQDVTLHDRYDLKKDQVLITGTQALVRLMLMQKARDRAAGLNTAGYVTGYRGSPLGAVDMAMTQVAKDLNGNDIRFQPGLNEDLAATALWGTQQAELRGEGRFDGVFGLWYGKGPGVDRSGDVMRHANMAGTSPHGGVLMALGDDHTGESSTVCHQSDFSAVDAGMPVLSPAGVQEILDFGLYGFALSRFSGLWAGLKLMKDTVEVTSVVDGRADRMAFATPDFAMPEGGLNIRLGDHWIAQEARLIDHKRFAAEAFARANRIDRRVHGRPGAKIGFVAAGKNWLDLVHALALLGLDDAACERLGLTTYKVGQTFPLDTDGFGEWAAGLDLIIVIEEKRKLLEGQIKEALFDDRQGCRVWGWRKGGLSADELFPVRFALDPVMIAEKLGQILIEEGRRTDALEGAMAKLAEARRADNAPDIATRVPYFCSGCPHNSSTKLPQGSRAYAGIGCHFMAQWMDRETSGFTHMGGEGANWVGEAPFSTRAHVFQNIGDGTYNHSGVQAIRFALMAGTNVTYKILYNDAVAMTGGQGNDGGLSADQIAREMLAMGVKTVAVVHDPNEQIDLSAFPKGVDIAQRGDLNTVQARLAETPGVSVLIYVQTCAAEKRRRRKRGHYPDPDRRVLINTDVCEGCGDCGVQSNCVSLVPIETELGRKRAIDQSSCNKDFSCISGFCPSFLTVTGGVPRKQSSVAVDIGKLPDPDLPSIGGTHNIVITGVGGTGVVTIGALIAMAAHLDGKGAAMMEMAGLAQKGGAVHIHCRVANLPSDISAIRVATGECDTLIGGDLVVSAGANTLSLMRTGVSRAVVNNHEIITGEFTRDTEFRIPGDQLSLKLTSCFKNGVELIDSTKLSQKILGDAIYSNMVLFGASWQLGQIPLTFAAIERAIELNGTAVGGNRKAFELGRWVALNPTQAHEIMRENVISLPQSAEDKIAFRAAHLTAYQGGRLAARYRKFLNGISDAKVHNSALSGYHKLLSYKDEYEVARLLKDSRAQAEQAFEGDLKLSYHLAPPIMSKTGPDGRPAKRAFGPWLGRALPILAWFKWLRHTPFDPFGYTAERKMERALIRQYERDMSEVLPMLNDATRDAIAELAELPLQIRGFGPVKQANEQRAAKRREELLAHIRSGGQAMMHAAQ